MFPSKKFLLLILVQFLLSNVAKGTEENGNINNGFCKEFSHLSLCQLHHAILQLDQLLGMTIGEIDFLAGDGAGGITTSNVGTGSTNNEEIQTPISGGIPTEKRVGARSLAGAPLLVRLASLGGAGTTSIRKEKIRPTTTSLLLGGPLRQSPSTAAGQARHSIYRLIRLPPGSRQLSVESPILKTMNQQNQQTNQLLRQLWA